MLHFESLEIPEKGGAQLMVLNTVMFPVGSTSIVKGAFDLCSAPTPR